MLGIRWLLLLCLNMALAPSLGYAQAAPPPETEEPAPIEPEADVFGRASPQGLVDGLVEALGNENYQLATNYLDLSALPESSRQQRGIELAQQLEMLLDAGGNVAQRWQLSAAPTGRIDDDRPLTLEQIGTLPGPDGAVELLAERVEVDDRQVWQVSAETLERVPELVANAAARVNFIDRVLPDMLRDVHFSGAPVGHWLILLGVLLTAFLVTRLAASLALLVLRVIWRSDRHERLSRLAHASAGPLSLYAASWIYFLSTRTLEVSIAARQQFSRLVEVIAVLSLVWLAWRLVDAFTDLGVERMTQRGQLRALSAAIFLRRTLKALLIGVALVFVLSVMGVDVTAGLAALGIGGLALALGAQKTIENFVSSMMIIGDQPLRVGDYCVIGTTAGTVEDIGMRSTRIRTLGRTVVTIPNGELATLQIENFAPRDRFWFHPTLGLRYETTPDQIRYLLVELRAMLYAHPQVDPDPARVRFLGLGAHSLNVEIFAYVNAVDYAAFLEVQEDLLLRVMDIVADSGTSFAFPSQTLYVASDTPPDPERTRQAENAVRGWREADDMQLPSFDPERIAELKATIDYPPEGSHLRSKQAEVQPTLFPDEPPRPS